ncbi:hypothetical protein [Alteromonas sp. C1M14]|uniref:hypothetical protein n=1 Tax=Alteromonas sp. C1M14 TaxID=2841567 RepID=UPI001C094F10|nr:hypothetical protein [Alteromonas sp. C1M14]MBU2977151.1 hypothetical protein [Alteromonas sp. C1M14]
MVKILALASLAFTQTAMADVNAYQQAATQFCNKVKMCITEEVKKETGGEVPAQMKAIIDSMTSKMCEQYIPEQIMGDPSQYAEMIEAGTQCLEDLAAVPCEQMSRADEPASCKEAQSVADKLGLDTST